MAKIPAPPVRKAGKQTSKPPTPASAEAKVGKGVPPRHTQFAKGKSGNPKGRPKGSKNLITIIMEAANDQVTATIDGKPRKISKVQAAAMQLATKAAGGDQASMGKLLDWVDEVEARAAAFRPAVFPFGPGDLEVLKQIYTRMQLSNSDTAP